MSVASKISLQIAAKTGARLWKISIPKDINKNTMLIGIETSMKKISENKIQKQVIGVVASVNADMTKYYSEVDIRSDKETTLT
jgi:aubergine-like protein